MRFLPALAAAALCAAALPANAANTVVVDFFVDGGDFQYACEDLVLPAGSTARAALDACQAAHGFTTAYSNYGADCFLDAVDGRGSETYDPSGLYLLGRYWMFHVDGVAPSTGLCGTLAKDGAALSVGWNLVAGYFVVVPNPQTAAWTAQHLP